MLRAKGRKAFLMQAMLVVAWFVGEVAGAIVATVVQMIRHGENVTMGIEIYFFAILGGLMGIGFTFLLAYMLPSQIFDRQLERRLDPGNPYAS